MGQRAPSVLRRGIVACTISHVEVPSGPSSGCGGDRQCMFMAGQLLHAQRRGANSAGNTRPPPSTPRLTGLRRGSHTARHSTAAGCRRPRSWPRKGYAYGTESHRRRWWSRSPPRYQFPRRQNRQRHSPYLALYVYGWPAVLPSASCCRQCRKHPATPLNPASTGAQTRITYCPA